jgi:hypothetical protein
VAWLEAIVITGALPAIAFWFNPADPFLLDTGFPWVILAPILIGSRYGFVHGFGSAMLLVAGLGGSWYLGWLPTETFPTELSLGLLFTGIVTGEFGQYWARRCEHVRARCNYLQMRLDQFSRVYQLLKASHTRLEQQVKGASVSLRTALLAFREELSKSQFQDGVPLGGMGDSVLRFFRECGGVQMAAVYQVSSPFGVDPSPAAQLGRPPPLVVSNPLLREAVKTGQTVAVQADDYSAAADGILAVVPLVDVQDQVWGVVTINEMPLVGFQHNSLDLLTIIAGYIGDAIRSYGGGGSWTSKGIADVFRSQLERCLRDVRRHQLPAGLVAVDIGDPQLFSSLLKLAQAQSRGLDAIWVPFPADNAGVVWILLPFTDQDGIASYVQRLEALLQQDLRAGDGDAVVSGRVLVAADTASGLIEEIEKSVHCRTEFGDNAGSFGVWQNAQCT